MDCTKTTTNFLMFSISTYTKDIDSVENVSTLVCILTVICLVCFLTDVLRHVSAWRTRTFLHTVDVKISIWLVKLLPKIIYLTLLEEEGWKCKLQRQTRNRIQKMPPPSWRNDIEGLVSGSVIGSGHLSSFFLNHARLSCNALGDSVTFRMAL